MKSKYMLSALAFLLVMTMTTTAFAQGVFRLSSGTEARGRMNSHAEATGDISLFLINGVLDDGVSNEIGTVKIDYGVPITNNIGADDGDVIVKICDDSPLTAAAEEGATGNRVSLSSDSETLTITVDVCDDDTGTQVINVEGVLLSLVGSGAESITASVTTSGDVRLLNDGDTVVISSVVSPLNDDTVEVAKKLELILHTGEPGADDKSPKGKFRLVVAEPHVDSFNGGANLRLEFSGIPDDVEITLDAWLTTQSNYEKDDDDSSKKPVDAGQNEITGIRPKEVSDDRTVVLTLMGTELPGPDGDLTDDEDNVPATILSSASDVVVIQGSISGTDEEELLPLDLEIQVIVDMGPIGEIDGTDVPRFDSNETTPLTVIESTSSQTKLTAPYVLYSAPYDTGIAVSNTSTNLTGAIHFAFYMAGAETKYSTSSMLAPKSTMSVLLSELLMNAGHTGDFVGYMTITTDFSGGIGSVFISDFAGFTAAVALQ